MDAEILLSDTVVFTDENIISQENYDFVQDDDKVLFRDKFFISRDSIATGRAQQHEMNQ